MTAPSLAPASGAAPTEAERALLRSLAVLRLVLAAWVCAVGITTRSFLGRFWYLAAIGVSLTVVWSALMWWLATHRTPPLTRQRWVALMVVELTLSASLLGADRIVWSINPGQRLASAWPVAAVLTIGVLAGSRPGAVAGAALGLANGLGVAGARATLGSVTEFIRVNGTASKVTLSVVSSAVLWIVAGAAAGLVAKRLTAAEATVAEARVREAMARDLHDGVLQTLAIVQRRSGDPDLAQLAREQELELRGYLAAPADATTGDDLPTALRDQAARAERRFGLRAEVVVAGVPDWLSPAVVAAVSAAAGEALTNAAKHGNATHATVFVDGDGPLFCSVKDNGSGFDPAAPTTGTGIRSSIVGRVDSIGGTATVTSHSGAGTEVVMVVPPPSATGSTKGRAR